MSEERSNVEILKEIHELMERQEKWWEEWEGMHERVVLLWEAYEEAIRREGRG